MSQKGTAWDFLRNSCHCDFLRRLLTEIGKKSSWEFPGGQLGPMAAQNPKWPPSDINLGDSVT